jgi:hypothetical protein
MLLMNKGNVKHMDDPHLSAASAERPPRMIFQLSGMLVGYLAHASLQGSDSPHEKWASEFGDLLVQGLSCFV